MLLEYVPLLQIQRDLYRLPRGFERFRAYLQTMIDPETRDLSLPPLVAMNPLGKDHVPAVLDQLLVFDADGVAARAIAEAATKLSHLPGGFKIGLAIADDLKGGWTNRYASEFSARFEIKPILKRGWLTGILMTCRFGDVAAQSLGYPPQGLSPRAGFALVLHEARMKIN